MKSKRKMVLYIATSLDGYIARKNGDIDWLHEIGNADEDYGYEEFYDTIDTIIMGKATYNQILTFGEWPYPDKKCYVFSSSKMKEDRHVEFINEDIISFTQNLRGQRGSDIWLVGGAGLIDSFIKENLIDEFIITIIPIILGDGISLFKKDNPEIKLLLKENKCFSDGMVQLHYKCKD